MANKFKLDYEQNSFVYYEVFKDHWKQITNVYNKSLINDDDVEIVKNNFDQMIILLLNEINYTPDIVTTSPPHHHHHAQLQHQPILSYLIAENIFEITYLWSLSYPEYLLELKLNQLKFYETLLINLNENKTSILFYKQIYKPLFLLLNNCSKIGGSTQIENLIISILNQLCVFIGKNFHLLNIFFDSNASSKAGTAYSSVSSTSILIAPLVGNFNIEQGPAKFLIFSLLIPYIHQDACFGQQARDALLMIMQLSNKNHNLAKYIVESTDFCPILATGLSALYSELPQKPIKSDETFFILTQEDVKTIKSLKQFINSLEFCNNVIQVSHSLIANQLLQYVYHGFLLSVIAPVLNQVSVVRLTRDTRDPFRRHTLIHHGIKQELDNIPLKVFELQNYMDCIDEVIATTIYFDLFLRTITEQKLVRLFIKFILYTKIDEMSILDLLINRINSNNKLSLATMNLFYTIIDLNSEDVIYKLILKYLVPCKHLMKSQLQSLKDTIDTSGRNAEYFLSLSTLYSNKSKQILSFINKINHNLTQTDKQKLADLSEAEVEWIRMAAEKIVLENVFENIQNMRYNFIDYLKDSKLGIGECKRECRQWTCLYDGVLFKYENLIRDNVNVDADEYLLNLFTNAIEINGDDGDYRKTSESRNDIDLYLDQTGNTYYMDDNEMQANGNHSKAKKSRNGTAQSDSRHNFYMLSFDNYISSTESASSSLHSSHESLVQENGHHDSEDEGDDCNVDNCRDSRTREIILNLFFSSQNSVDFYLNSNLNNFLNGLDELNVLVKRPDAEATTAEDFNSFCENILNSLYDYNSNLSKKPLSVKCEEPALPPVVEPVTVTSNGEAVNEIVLVEADIDIGPFLRALFVRLENMLNNTLEINFLLTGLITRLCYYAQPLMRSLLLDNNVVLQSNVKSLSNVLSMVGNRIETCSETYNNFSLLYLQAKMALVKRLVDLKDPIGVKQVQVQQKPKPQPVAVQASTATNRKFSDKILGFFRRSSQAVVTNGDNGIDSHQKVQILDDFKMRFFNTSPSLYEQRKDSIQMRDLTANGGHHGNSNNNDWDDLKTRNIAYAAVIYDEFLKELASICEEHCIQQF